MKCAIISYALVLCSLLFAFPTLGADENGPFIILLNGTSSAGKSSIAAKLQEQCPDPLWYTGLDAMLSSIQRRYDEDGPQSKEGFQFIHGHDAQGPIVSYKEGPLGRKICHAWHASLKTLAENGMSVVIDEVLFSEPLFQDYLEQLKNVRVYFIAVKPPVEVAQKREKERGDRLIGLARGLYEISYANKIHDLEIDSSKMSPEAAATLILDFIKTHPKPMAFAANSKREG